MEKLKWIYETLENSIAEEMGKGVENVNCEEMGNAIDMLKDVAETMYRMSIVNAMERGEDTPRRLTID